MSLLPRKGFTLVEMLVAISLIAIVMGITFSTFYSVSDAWQRGLRMAESLNHGEYVMDQLVHGLRSAYFPAAHTNSGNGSYGFALNGGGSGPYARDKFSWVKTGASLLGLNNPLQTGVHRVQVSIENDEDDRSCVAVRSWRPYGIPDGFVPDNMEPFFVSAKAMGIVCRVSTNLTDDGWEWENVWQDAATNHLPLAVEITLYMEPLHEDEEPVKMKRLVEIPVGPLSWNKRGRR